MAWCLVWIGNQFRRRWPGRRSRRLALGVALWVGPLGLAVPRYAMQALGQTPPTEAAAPFFADVLVRGQPVFQGGLPDAIATERAGQISRRIAALHTRAKR